ncbi:hypothetical protein H9P43_007113 [Blastocladiella emersonii ATCC 22665]|nr:hypothetical protein H9P43_007113 [Blastocladiella emersonii ATCC 22665]
MPLPLSFWRAVPVGALDGVKDARWIAQAVVVAMRKGDTACLIINQICRAAPKTVASPEYAEAMVAVHYGQ